MPLDAAHESEAGLRLSLERRPTPFDNCKLITASYPPDTAQSNNVWWPFRGLQSGRFSIIVLIAA